MNRLREFGRTTGPGRVLHWTRSLGNIGRHSDLLLIGLFVAIIALMVLPLPPWALDSLIAANLSISVVVLVVAVYIRSPLGLSTFPALLLFTTLFRLSLNIASTRQILLTGNAGDVIKTFGQMVVGGDVIVGLVVFLIIALVQFIVIAKGSERIAEVGARFSLDAMPGKQMSIDADLRAGLISKDEARTRRRALESESQLYGAMDGAMKFVKGDAIAAIVIAVVNILGGIAIGMLRRDMSLGAATQVYSVLAVGDAMVSQIPSLFMSVAAGIVVTRVAQDDKRGKANLAQDIAGQLQAHPRALMIAGVVIAVMGAVPGFPWLPFALLGAGFVAGGWWALPAQQRTRQGSAGFPMPAFAREGGDVVPCFGQDRAPTWAAPLALAIPAALASRVDAHLLDAALARHREALQRGLGLPFPGVALQSPQEPDAIEITVHGVPVLSFGWLDDHVLLRSAPGLEWPTDALPGPDLLGQATAWIRPSSANGDQTLGLEAAIALALARCIEARPDKFMGVQEALVLTQRLEAELPELEKELRQLVPLPRLAEVCRLLLEEGISLRDLSGLAQALVDQAGREKDTLQLVEKVRRALAEQISHQHVNAKGELAALLLAPALEEQLTSAVRVSARGSQLALPSAARQAFVGSVERLLHAADGTRPAAVVLVHTAEIRPALRALLKDAGLAGWAVLSVDELRSDVHVQVIGEVAVMTAHLD